MQATVRKNTLNLYIDIYIYFKKREKKQLQVKWHNNLWKSKCYNKNFKINLLLF